MSVYTRITQEELTEFIERYDLGKVTTLSGISAGMENTNYALSTTQGEFILTIYEHYSHEELPFFLDLMQHLSKHQVKSITPVSDRQGQVLQSLSGKPAALIERLSGVALQPNEATTKHCEIIGEALAKFHLAGMSFDQQRSHDRHEDLSPELIDKLLPKLSKEDHELIQQEMESQQHISWEDLPSGIIHADLFCDNSIFDVVDNKPVLSGIIDLYLACNDAFIYDIAIVANDWCCHSDGSLDEDRWLPMLTAYNKIRPITKNEKQVWVAMLRLSNLRFWVSRLDIMLFPPKGDLVMKKDPDELKNKLLACLRDEEKIVQQLETIM